MVKGQSRKLSPSKPASPPELTLPSEPSQGSVMAPAPLSLHPTVPLPKDRPPTPAIPLSGQASTPTKPTAHQSPTPIPLPALGPFFAHSLPPTNALPPSLRGNGGTDVVGMATGQLSSRAALPLPFANGNWSQSPFFSPLPHPSPPPPPIRHPPMIASHSPQRAALSPRRRLVFPWVGWAKKTRSGG